MILAFQLLGGPMKTREMKELTKVLVEAVKTIRSQYDR